MGLLSAVLLLSVAIAIINTLVSAKDQEGYVSIDCGLPANYSYIDTVTRIGYMSDEAFVDTGVRSSISSEFSTSSLAKQLQLVRSFPEGDRNCYVIAVYNDSKYLIRATFMYADYDGLNQVPEFDLHIGPNRWDTVVLENLTSVIYKEIIHETTMSYVHVCLVNTGQGTPFISALELRPLKDVPYKTETGPLACSKRLDLGSMSSEIVRYPADVLDRIWVPYSLSEWATIDTVEHNSHFDYQMPFVVMRTAATPTNADLPLMITIDSKDGRSLFYMYVYFAELVRLNDNEFRQFELYLDGYQVLGPQSPAYFVILLAFNQQPISGAPSHNLSIVKGPNSTLPPFFNAIEIYTVVELTENQTDQMEVEAMMNIKSTYGIKRNWQGDPCAPQAYIWNALLCSRETNIAPKIISLNLSSSGLIGEITHYILNLTHLQSLDLSNNNLTGPVPEFLTQLQFLEVLNLSHNKLTGIVPPSLVERSKQNSLVLSIAGSPNLCLSLPCTSTKEKPLLLMVSLLSAVVVFILGAGLVLLLARLRRHKKASVLQVKQSNSLVEPNERRFTYSHLMEITNNFERVIGQGGFGNVYHGRTQGNQVAVKMLTSPSVHGYKQFQAEVDVLLRVHHENLVSLVGYCDEIIHLGLVYEYMGNGSLSEYLSDGSKDPLPWEERLKISLGAARGLEYLHSGCRPQIVHRDVKTKNILLDEKLHAKLADFGLSRTFPICGGSYLYTEVVGTFGYFDPEYYRSLRFTTKSDVYSFGVVLLETVTSRPAISETDEMTHIKQWVSSMLEDGQLEDVVDPRLHGEFDVNSVKKAVEVAMDCVSPTSLERPTMHQLVNELSECLELELARKKWAQS